MPSKNSSQCIDSQSSFNLHSTMREFEDFITHNAPRAQSFHPHYQRALWEMVLAGGKRFRPALCLCVVGSLAPQMLQNAFLPALAIESIHTYSLIHDDLPCMDNSPLRRGYPTLHTTYNETLALLVGDALNTYAFELLSCARLDSHIKVALMLELSKSAGAMVLGQVLDCEFENTKLEIDKLQCIHHNKTSQLIIASLKMGGLIGNVSDCLLEQLARFGKDLGLFFQVRDDLIDVLGDSAIEGKALQNDTLKNTYVNLLGISGAQQEHKNLTDSLKNQLDEFPDSLAFHLRGFLQPYFQEINPTKEKK